MAQITIYLTEDIAKTARKRAKEENESLSAWIADLVRRETTTEWPRSLLDVLEHGAGDIAEPYDPPPEDVESLR